MNPARIRAIFKRLAKANPNPTTELQYNSNFELLIAVMLSAQATDASVNRATPALFAKASTPQAMVKLGLSQLKQHIQTIGLYNTKAKNIIATSHILCKAQHPNVIPNTLETLTALPGVGRKTANVVLNTAFGQATMPVDTHIFRLAHRLGWAKGKTPEAVERELLAVIPKAYLAKAHHWLILHGRYTCLARKPRCQDCLIAELCPSFALS